jgi:competence protein ComEA
LNTATAAQLESLPGVGPVMAKRILDWREAHNRFSKISELQEIQGIGPKLFEQLKVAVRI